MSQMDLFGKDPTKVQYKTKLPKCGVCEVKDALYYTPSNLNVWLYSCSSCSRTIRDERFINGYTLSTALAELTAIEVTPKELVLVKGKRVVRCPICKKKHKVTSTFYGSIICFCALNIRVKDLWNSSK